MKKYRKEDKEKIINILVDSFERNKSIDFVVGKSAKSRRILMEYSLENCLENGEVFISDSGNSCVLLKYSERKNKPLKLWFLDLKLALLGMGLSRIPKVLKRERVIEKKQPEHVFLYLWFIGVTPEFQGRGEGSDALTFVLNLAKEQNLPVRLETSTDVNFKWYESFGFKVYESSAEFGFPFYFYKREF
ncbi:ribosomal protein S18 acetylase RimI-like enzyme [Algoriphagus sp. 4150]|uniref:GNAT family N-acetyltransferase n=1 Tax=Algoriphagus sp. 4150 TaxID=2817756 RepID=UPI0028554E29|nr:GNAT family N-acetyltransferase [Algoriphagus sp. 4150]MDR7130346.1 ribosomal protein S18 acetylase RimI-like enzyme [Algoriphagus sp. 4150]